MVNNPIELVRQTEINAETVISQAMRDAAQLLTKAEKQAADLVQESIDTARTEAETAVTAAHQKSCNTLESAQNQLEEQFAGTSTVCP